MLFFTVFAMAITYIWGRETYHPVLRKRAAEKRGVSLPQYEDKQKVMERIKMFLTVALFRPVHMLLTEPIVSLMCLYVACEFATLFSFFAAVPFVFREGAYRFGVEDTGLVFLSVVIGCLLGVVTIIVCEVVLYRPKAAALARSASGSGSGGSIQPEYRLYPAMIGSIGPPVGLFWFAWTARPEVSWVSPALAVVVL